MCAKFEGERVVWEVIEVSLGEEVIVTFSLEVT